MRNNKNRRNEIGKVFSMCCCLLGLSHVEAHSLKIISILRITSFISIATGGNEKWDCH